jgi:short-subunit dehydrogenase
LAALLVSKEKNVIVSGRHIEKIELESIGKVRMDVSDKQCKEILLSILEKYNVDTVVVSSGIGFVNHDLDEKKEEETLLVNVTGFLRCVLTAYKYFDNNGVKGMVVGISSVAGRRGLRHAPAYSASKAFVSEYLFALRHKSIYEKKGIDVIDIRPGFVATPLISGESSDYAFFTISANKAAKGIYNAMKRRKNIVYVPWYWRIIAVGMRWLLNFLFFRL